MKKAIHIVAYPLHSITQHKKHYFRFLISTAVAVAGVLLAQMHTQAVPHLVTDCLGYGIHGIAFSNIIKVVNELLKIEL